MGSGEDLKSDFSSGFICVRPFFFGGLACVMVVSFYVIIVSGASKRQIYGALPPSIFEPDYRYGFSFGI
jgi:hypothetical protein